MKPILYSRQAIKTLQRLPENVSKLITRKIEQYAADPASLANNVSAMKGQHGKIRLRVGDWRVLMRDGAVLSVEKVGPRGSVYD